jgi:hypothetical protein
VSKRHRFGLDGAVAEKPLRTQFDRQERLAGSAFRSEMMAIFAMISRGNHLESGLSEFRRSRENHARACARGGSEDSPRTYVPDRSTAAGWAGTPGDLVVRSAGTALKAVGE